MDVRPIPVTVRRVDENDAEELQAFYAALSPESRRRRFLGFSPGIDLAHSRSFCTPDHRHNEGFVAVRGGGGPHDGRIVGHLCLEPDRAGGVELAVAVADEHQGQGTGRRLFEAALRWAERTGVRRIAASAYADNAAVLRLLSSAPQGVRATVAGDGLVSVEIPLPPRDAAVSARRRRGASRRTPRPAPAAAGSASRGSS